jgi:hypothetical protein
MPNFVQRKKEIENKRIICFQASDKFLENFKEKKIK